MIEQFRELPSVFGPRIVRCYFPTDLGSWCANGSNWRKPFWDIPKGSKCGWRVTHAPSGRCLPWVDTSLPLALKIADEIENAWDGWSQIAPRPGREHEFNLPTSGYTGLTPAHALICAAVIQKHVTELGLPSDFYAQIEAMVGEKEGRA